MPRTIALNKPYRVLSRFTADGSANRPLSTITPALPTDVWPVGRLDADSEGLLVLSSDQRLVDELLSPERKHAKTYLAQVERVPGADVVGALEAGVVVDGKRTLPAQARVVEEPAWLWPRDPPIRFRRSVPTAWLELTIVEGRNRQVRKMTAALGFPTLRLLRVAIGALGLVGRRGKPVLAPGEWRVLDDADQAGLRDSKPVLG